MTVRVREEPSSRRSAAHPLFDCRVAAPILILAAASYGTFIARTAFRVDGQLWFSLFDDAMISMRYARNLASGHGLVWNTGQVPVEGYTNFLWTIAMAGAHLLPVSSRYVSLVIELAGLGLLVATALVAAQLARVLSDGATNAGPIALWLTAFYYPLAYWTLRGMEVGAVALTCAGALLLLVRAGRRVASAAAIVGVASAAVLLRTDAAVPLLAIAAATWWWAPEGEKRGAVLLAAAVIAAAVAHAGFRLTYYGTPLPNTFYLKLTGAPVSARIWRGVGVFGDLFRYHLAGAALFGILAWRRIAADWRLRAAAAAVSAACGYSIFVGGDAWEYMHYANRYVSAVMPIWIVVCAIGIDAALDDRPLSSTLRAALAVTGLMVLAVGTAGFGIEPPLVGGFTAHRLALGTACVGLALALSILEARRPRLFDSIRTAAASRWPRAAAVAVTLLLWSLLNAHAVARWILFNGYSVGDDANATRIGVQLHRATTPDASIAVTQAGAIPYFADRPALDILGKNDPRIARMKIAGAPYPGHDKEDLGYTLSLRPDVLVLGDDPDLATRRTLRAHRYREVYAGTYVADGDSRVFLDRLALDPRVRDFR